jgi:two-component system nitrate/nitrite response regulator NarL
MRILIVDDHAIMLDGLVSIFKEIKDAEIVSTSSNGNFALATIKSTAIDLMLTDYSMPDMDGLILVKKAKEINPNLKVMVLTMHNEPVKVQDMIALEIDAYILKKYAQQELKTAYDVVKNGGKFWSNEVNDILVRGLGLQTEELILTDREIDVLKLIIEEKNSREIAEILFISERTVETHRKNMIRKTNSHSTVGLIKYAYEHGLVN